MMRNVFGTIVGLGIGLLAFYFGFFHADAVCDDQPNTDWACHVQAAFTNELGFLFVGAAFVLFGLWMLYRTVRKSRITHSGARPPVQRLL